jgi:hypothetical protein
MLAGVLLAVSATPAHAQSAAEQRAAILVFQDYAPDGRIDPCKHSSQQLKLAQDNIPPDIEQYAADYPAAIAAAIDARARGECNGSGGKPPKAVAVPVVPTSTPTPSESAAPGTPTKKVVNDPPQPERAGAPATAAATGASSDPALERVAAARAGNDAPAPVLLLGILAALLALTGALLFAMRRYGIGEERLAGPAHAIREARWRTSGVWQDFVDWVRLGR